MWLIQDYLSSQFSVACFLLCSVPFCFVLPHHAPNGFLMTACRHNTPSHLYPSWQRDWVCVECLEDRGDIKKQMHLIYNTHMLLAISLRCRCLNNSSRSGAALHEPGGDTTSFSILPGVATCCVKTIIRKG